MCLWRLQLLIVLANKKQGLVSDSLNQTRSHLRWHTNVITRLEMWNWLFEGTKKGELNRVELIADAIKQERLAYIIGLVCTSVITEHLKWMFVKHKAAFVSSFISSLIHPSSWYYVSDLFVCVPGDTKDAITG